MKGNKPARKFFVDFRYDICIIKQGENKGFNVLSLRDLPGASREHTGRPE